MQGYPVPLPAYGVADSHQGNFQFSSGKGRETEGRIQFMGNASVTRKFLLGHWTGLGSGGLVTAGSCPPLDPFVDVFLQPADGPWRNFKPFGE